MPRIRSIVSPLVLLSGAACATVPPAAQDHGADAANAAAPAPHRGHVVKPNEIDAHVRFLASDLLEGRAPATRGGRLAAEYIASQLQLFGVEPGANGSYFQEFPIEVWT